MKLNQINDQMNALWIHLVSTGQWTKGFINLLRVQMTARGELTESRIITERNNQINSGFYLGKLDGHIIMVTSYE